MTPSKMFSLNRVKCRAESEAKPSIPDHLGGASWYQLRFSHYPGTLLWYRQDQGKSLESLFSLKSNGAVRKKGRLTACLDTKARHSPLPITASQPGLSATYFSAVDAVSPDSSSLYPNLQLWLPPTPLLQGLQF